MGETYNRKEHRYQATMQMEMEGGSGVTRDLSVSGVYFETELSFAAGNSIEFTILFDEYSVGKPKRMNCRGKIVRVEKKRAKIGVAAEILSFAFEVTAAVQPTAA